MKIFIITPAGKQEREYINNSVSDRHTLMFKEDFPKHQQFAEFEKCDILLGNAPVEWFENDLPVLKWWQLESAGFDKYVGLKLGASTTNVGDFYAQPCAETVVAGLAALYRQIHQISALQPQKKWLGPEIRLQTRLLFQSKVIVLGAGQIAQIIKKILLGYDCNVKLMARTSELAVIKSKEQLKKLLPETDIVISTLPGTAVDFFSKDLIEEMKRGSVFANIGRGNTVDEKVLIEHLQNGHLGGAVLDVNEIEPLPEDNPLWEMPNVIVSQHTGGGNGNEHLGKFKIFVENLALFENNLPLMHQINLVKGY